MFRLSKITDYGIVLLAHLATQARARESQGLPSAEEAPHNARELAAEVNLPIPVVSKILKALARAGVLESQRGAKGGYALARRAEQLSVAEMIAALDGPLALTQCTVGSAACVHEGSCAVRNPWQVINEVVRYALTGVTLADLINPGFSTEIAPLSSLARFAEQSDGGTHLDESLSNTKKGVRIS